VILDLHIRRAEITPIGTRNDAVDSVGAARLGGDRRSWNNSSTRVQIIYRRMSAQGWHGEQMELPNFLGEVEELPGRPPDPTTSAKPSPASTTKPEVRTKLGQVGQK